jgi:hypothetical protein
MSYRRLKNFLFEFNELASSFRDAETDSSQWEILRQRSSSGSQNVKASLLMTGCRAALVSSAVDFSGADWR